MPLNKKVTVVLLVVLLVVFLVALFYGVKQWKTLSLTTPAAAAAHSGGTTSTLLSFLKPKTTTTTTTTSPKKSARWNQACVRPPPPPLDENTDPTNPLRCMQQAPQQAPPPQAPPLPVMPLPLYQSPSTLTPNFECSPLNTFAPRSERDYVLYADSACRDFTVYPTSQEYYFKFPTPMYNVFAIEVIQAIIPRGEYDINVNNQTLWIQEDTNEPVPVVNDIGDYGTVPLLAAEIGSKMAAAGLVNTYTVTSVDAKLVFTRTAGALPFALLFTPEYDPYQLSRQAYGFPPGVAEATAGGVIQAPFRTALDSLQYVDIVCPDISKNFLDTPILARIPVMGGLNNVTEYDPQQLGNRKYWPLARVTGLTLQFFAGPTCPSRSVLYNFNGLDNSLTLKFSCLQYKNVFIDDYCIEQML